MKLVFNKIKTTADTIQVSFDGGNTWGYSVSDLAKNNTIDFTEEQCPDLSKIKVKCNLKTISDIDFVASINNEPTIPVSSFVNWDTISLDYLRNYLAKISIPEGVTTIAESGFSGCMYLEDIKIPDSVTSIGHSAFNGCRNLISITIPNSVTSIAENTFTGCDLLMEVTIPGNVISIGFAAFSNCSNLKSITIPNSVTSIEGYAFLGCSSLEEIKYKGTEEQWNQITKGQDAIPYSVTVTFNN